MPIAVEVVPPAQFAAWVASKGGKMAGSRPAAATAAAPAQGAPTGTDTDTVTPAPAAGGSQTQNPAPAKQNPDVANRTNQ